VRAFLRQRLRIAIREIYDEVQDELPVELDGLERWAVGQRLLEARLAGVEMRTAIRAEAARGTLPPWKLGEPVARELATSAERIVSAARTLIADDAEQSPVDVHVTQPDGSLLSGTISAMRGDLLLSTTFARVSARHRLATWTQLLALSASHPERTFCAATVGRGREDTVTVARIGPLAPDEEGRRRIACEQLAVLLDLYERGMREPLPIYCLSSAEYAAAAARGADPIAAAEGAWKSAWNYPKEDADLEHQLVLSGLLRFEELLVEPPRADEQGSGWDMSETSRFGRLARRLWDGPLRHEEVEIS
jgi:exodeoxyribonuclease V gamma subunit